MTARKGSRTLEHAALGDDYGRLGGQDRRVGALMLPRRLRIRTRNAVHGVVENVFHYDAKAEVTIDPKSLVAAP